ncbi:MAG TPA: long-chain fatty acid--CoA ligase [Gammaproteobacteria bacterium]|nr:long-chain fatty acid--CoA ligase [Gammaproteobacteria bacterium]
MSRAREHRTDYIDPGTARHLPGLFRERVRRAPDALAYRHYDANTGNWVDTTWAQMAAHVASWQAALSVESLAPGDRVALMLRNCREWVMLDQAALGLGLVVVPLYTNDRPENVAFILRDAGVRLLLVEDTGQCQLLAEACAQVQTLQRIVTLSADPDSIGGLPDERVVDVETWLARGEPCGEEADTRTAAIAPDDLASIVYTSGTTGRPKGVMLSHHNMLWNAWAGLQHIAIYPDDVFLSFLPLSHTLERTVGYYIPIVGGAAVAYARSITELPDDLLNVRPTMLVTVPRIFERIYNRVQESLAGHDFKRTLFRRAVDIGWTRFLHAQGRRGWSAKLLWWPLLDALVARKLRARLGGRLAVAISGGAPLPFEVARTFIGLGLTIAQGYGLTETSPVISVNRLEDNDPESVGEALPDVELRLGSGNELQVRSPGVMLGYWNNPQATRDILDPDGWLHTGDQARIERNHIYITGRLKEIIVLANGEKIAPADVEQAVAADPLIDQVMVIGEQRAYLSALVVLNAEGWRALAERLALNPDAEASVRDRRVEEAVLDAIAPRLHSFPGYAVVRRAAVTLEPWTVDNALATPTMKLRRDRILKQYRDSIEKLYVGH